MCSSNVKWRTSQLLFECTPGQRIGGESDIRARNEPGARSHRQSPRRQASRVNEHECSSTSASSTIPVLRRSACGHSRAFRTRARRDGVVRCGREATRAALLGAWKGGSQLQLRRVAIRSSGHDGRAPTINPSPPRSPNPRQATAARDLSRDSIRSVHDLHVPGVGDAAESGRVHGDGAARHGVDHAGRFGSHAVADLVLPLLKPADEEDDTLVS